MKGQVDMYNDIIQKTQVLSPEFDHNILSDLI